MFIFVPIVTSTAALGAQHLHSVQDRLWVVRMKWFVIGLALEIDPATLEVIKMDNPNNTNGAFQSMLLMWLRKRQPVPCWKALVEALRSPSVGVVVGKWVSKLAREYAYAIF